MGDFEVLAKCSLSAMLPCRFHVAAVCFVPCCVIMIAVPVLFYSKMSVISASSDLLLHMGRNCRSVLLSVVLPVQVKSQLFYDTVVATRTLTLPTSYTFTLYHVSKTILNLHCPAARAVTASSVTRWCQVRGSHGAMACNFPEVIAILP